MNRKFKRVIASLLAFVMLAFAAPSFSASAATESNGYASWTDTVENGGHPIGWWGDNNFRQWENDAITFGGLTYPTLNSSPDTDGLETPAYSDYVMGGSMEAYLGQTEFMAPFTDFGADFGDTSSYDAETNTISEICQMVYDHMSDLTPMMTVTVSDQGVEGDQIYRQFYGYSTSYTYDAVKEAGNILNPAQLKAGQRIAVTVELSGMDTLRDGQISGIWNADYLSPGYYSSKPTSTNDRWVDVSDQDSVMGAVLKCGYSYYSGAVVSVGAYSTIAGTYLGTSSGSGYGMYETYGDESTYGGMVITPFGGGMEPYASYTGYDVLEADDYIGSVDGGMIIGVFSFTVLQDCDLSDVLIFQCDTLGSNWNDTTYFQPWSNVGDNAEAGFTAVKFSFDQTGTCNTSFRYTYGVIGLEYNDYEAAEETEHTHDFTDAEAVGNGDGTHTYTCVSEDCDQSDGYQTTEDCTAGETVIENEVAATCTTAGYYDEVTYCTVCGDELSRDTVEVAATGHSYTSEITTAATCTEDGVLTYTCSECGDTYTEAIAATGHTWDDGEVTTAADCTNEGVMTYTCTVCGETKTEVISAKGHTKAAAVKENEVAATCTEAGSYDTVVYCSVCGAEISRVTTTVAATGHDFQGEMYVEWAEDYSSATAKIPCLNCDATDDYELEVTSETTDATCTADGETVYTASFGDTVIDTQTVTIEATGHTYVATVTDPTCTEQGYTTYTCVEGDDSYVADYTDATGHDYGAYVSNDDGTHTATCANDASHTDTQDCEYSYAVTTAPSYTEAGVGTYTCDVCGYSYTVEIPATDCEHANTTIINDKAATCTEDGYTGDTYCNDCGQIIATGTTIPATGHDYVAVVTAPTCTEGGYTTYTCSVCGDSYVADETEATGHSYEAVTTPATCTEDGSIVYTCSVCGDTYTETIAATGHDYEAVVTAPTCTEGGYTTYTCSVCGDSYVADETEATGHTWDDGVVTKEATYTEAGVMTYTCTVCGETKTEEIPMLTDGVIVAVYKTDLGLITVEGDDDGDQSVTVPRNSTVTITAEAVDGAEFVGWAIGAKMVSTDATYTVTALADVTYTAVFTETVDDTFTVVFADSYGNVISTQDNLTSGADIVIPEATNRPGYTFTGWSLSDEEIAALTAGTTIYAEYTKTATSAYTVTASGATITTADAEATDVLTDVAFDTQVTVYAEGATSWSLADGTVVAYGDTYTFYVGADITLTANYDSVTVTPAVAITNATNGIVTDTTTTSSGLIKAYFLATRTMTDDCTYVSSGFIYGKAENVTGTTTLDDVDNSTVKRAETSTTSDQFALTYGLSAQSGSVAARAYLAYTDASGATQVVYSDLATFTY